VQRNPEYFRVSYQPIDAAIAALAAKQNGNVTTKQLLGLGLDMDAILYRVKIGRLYRVYRGVYSVGRPAVTPLERATAAVLACGPGAALSHGSAMTLWGLWRHWDEPLEVSAPRYRRPKRIILHRSTTLSRRDVTTHLGVRTTTATRTVLDMTPRQTDKQLKRTVSTALHTPWLTESQLAESLARHPHRPGAKRLASLIGLPGTPPRAGWEHDFPAFCAAHALPTPVMGAIVCGYVVDALFVDEKLIVELDSWEFHKDAITFQADRERDAETLASGLATVRITWERIEQSPGREGARLRRILARRRRSLTSAA
jgi:hypothetical protein